MNGDITSEARWHRRSASKVISPFIIFIFAVFDVSFMYSTYNGSKRVLPVMSFDNILYV